MASPWGAGGRDSGNGLVLTGLLRNRGLTFPIQGPASTQADWAPGPGAPPSCRQHSVNTPSQTGAGLSESWGSDVSTLCSPCLCSPCKPMMDRNKAAELPKLQVGFIDFVCSFVYKVRKVVQGLARFSGAGAGVGSPSP